MRAACAVVEAIDDQLLANVRERGAVLEAALAELPGVLEVRGRGLLLAAVTERPAAEIVDACRERGLLVLTADDHVVRFAPPLTVSAPDVEDALHILLESCIS